VDSIAVKTQINAAALVAAPSVAMTAAQMPLQENADLAVDRIAVQIANNV
jgi:hypothetical protein